jgi:hypothetical protein
LLERLVVMEARAAPHHSGLSCSHMAVAGAVVERYQALQLVAAEGLALSALAQPRQQLPQALLVILRERLPTTQA